MKKILLLFAILFITSFAYSATSYSDFLENIKTISLANGDFVQWDGTNWVNVNNPAITSASVTIDDEGWVGLAVDKGRIVFNDETTDLIEFKTCAVDVDGAFTATTVGSDGTVTATTDVISGDDVILPATGKLSLDGATPTTYWEQTADDILDGYVGGTHMITFVEAATDYIEPKAEFRVGNLQLTEDGGAMTIADMNVTSTPDAGTQQSYAFKVDANSIMHVGAFADGAGGIISPHIGMDKPVLYDWHQFNDNFLWTAGIYGIIWDITTFDVDGGGGTNAQKTSAGAGGVVELITEGDGDDIECSASQGVFFSRAIQAIATVHISLTTDLAGKEVEFGFSDNPMVDDGEHVAFLFDYSDDADQWQTKSVDGTDVSLAAGANPTAGTKQDLKLVLETNGTAHFFVDHVWYATVVEAIDNDTGMYLFFGVKDEGAVAEGIEVEGIWAAWKD